MKEENGNPPKDLGFVDRLVARWIWGAAAMVELHRIEQDSPSVVRTYQCRNKKNQSFIILKVKNHSPYREEICGFTHESVFDSLSNWCEPADAGQPM